MKKIILCISLLLYPSTIWALDIEGVQLPNQVEIDGITLPLNGAGIRTKFFFDIYVGALYLTHTTKNATAILANPNPARITMNILYSEVDKEKLRKGWIKGFQKNQQKDTFAALKDRLQRFNAMFTDLRKGDQVIFDFLSDGTTSVNIKGKQLGKLAGIDFQRALLSVWLGDKPADSDLKQAMLHNNE